MKVLRSRTRSKCATFAACEFATGKHGLLEVIALQHAWLNVRSAAPLHWWRSRGAQDFPKCAIQTPPQVESCGSSLLVETMERVGKVGKPKYNFEALWLSQHGFC